MKAVLPHPSGPQTLLAFEEHVDSSCRSDPNKEMPTSLSGSSVSSMPHVLNE